MNPKRAVVASLFLLATTLLRADTVVRIKVGGDVIALPGRSSAGTSCEPCVDPPRPGDVITISLSPGHVRRDRGASSIILREDSKKLLLVCQRSRQYSELSYPIKFEKLKDKGPGLPISNEFLMFQLVSPGTTGKSQVRSWPVDTFDATVTNGFRNQIRLHLAVADLGGASDLSLLEFRKLLNELEYSGHGWSKLLPFSHGAPIVWEEAQRQPETEFVYKEEITDIQDRPVPAETYEIPQGYREVKFDRSCVPFR